MDENLNNALKAHDLYWTSYINGQVDIVASLLDENYQQIGSVEEEVFFNKKDAVGFVKKTIDQVAGKVEMRNRVTKSEKLSGYILINEFFDLYVKTDENWFFYAKFRTSSLMHQKADGWKLVHQHSSLPDSKTEEGENIAIEKINQENLELKNAIKRRTIELEHKNRELEIEAALERVRAKAMAMHKSEELTDTSVVLFHELKKLGIEPRRCGFAIKQPEGPEWQFWHTTKEGQAIEKVGRLSEAQVPFFKNVFTAWKGGKAASHTSTFSGAELNHVIHFLIERTEVNLPDAETEVEQGIYPTQVCFNFFFFKHGSLLAHTLQPLKSEDRKLLERFAQIFEQTYTRFLDLQKAETQAREARIEASLEKIRARALGMQSPDELGSIVGHIYQELTLLDLNLDRAFIQIFDPQSLDVTWWMASNENPSIQKGYRLQHNDYPLQLAYVKGWRELAERWQYILEGEEKKAWDEYIFSETELAQLPEVSKDAMKAIERAFVSASFAGFGCITLGSPEPLPEDSFDILQRFTRVFDFAYTRFLDLQKAQVQAREAQIETALERIRAKALAMHESDELMAVALTLREQMGLLGQKEMEASVIHFYNLKKNTIQSWHVLNTPGLEQGDQSSESFEIRKNACQLTQQFFNEFQSKKTEYSIVVEGEVLLEWMEYLNSISPEIKESIKGLKPDRAFFYFSKFSEGALLMVSSTPPTEESKYLQKRAAQVFELAYKRYLDLKQAEKLAEKAKLDMIRLKEEKEKTEEALKELEATQAQLVQQEKLASLGQLTAGIAHEIKNPLNFVNNFSELSVELIEEAKEELSAISRQLSAEETDKLKDVLERLDNIDANLKKIHEHGSRADSIVKSMLQHSRGGNRVIEPTPINPVIKEYVNLAFHGMRAGKNPINVDMEVDLDDSIGKVPLIAEDFSRVIVNLCNNAFDAMREKLSSVSSQQSASYKAVLMVRTKAENGNVVVEIEDNGPGIPDEIKDKILQPFFTTKKGTDGTGLGLSITNDIIKAHAGTIEIETIKGEGTLFKIQLPLKG